jgi:alanyl-tRNA synthetase
MLRRALRYARDLGVHDPFCAPLAGTVIDLFSEVYPDLADRRAEVTEAMEREEIKFKATLERGLRQYARVAAHVVNSGAGQISGAEAFDLFETFGFPLPLTVELAGEQGLAVDEGGFEQAYRKHREKSREASVENFKGGMADHTELTTRLHTATHLLHQALRQVLGPGVHQMGSNITVERLRFDFSYPERLTDEQLAAVEEIVNVQIARDLPVSMAVLPRDEALASGALAFFGEKYGEQVKVYTIGDFSKEVCGGPHVTHTGELGKFEIVKQEAVGQGVRRIRGVLRGRT